VFAFALLDNHFHLFLRTPHGDLSAGMRDFEGGYVTLFNRRHQREGHLFQSRFHAVLVENDRHAWELTRYVHLNSLRAGAVRDPLQDRWSSYRYYLNPTHAPAWLDWQTVLAEFGGTESQARVAYKRFVDAGTATPPPNPLAAAADGWILGSDEFVAQCRAWRERTESRPIAVSLQQVLDAVAAALGTEPEQITQRAKHGNRGRDAAILLARELVAEPLDVLAERFGGVTRSAISETARRAGERVARDQELAALVAGIRRSLGH
jgi:hypothetical protein